MDLAAENAITHRENASTGILLKPRRLLLWADIIGAAIAVLATYGVIQLRGGGTSLQVAVSVIMAVLTLVIALGLLARVGQYTNRRRLSAPADISTLARDLLIALAVASLFLYLTKGFFTGYSAPSRLAVVTFVLVFFVLGSVSRIGLRSYQHRLFAKGRTVRNVLVVGSGPTATDFIDFTRRRPWLGVTIAGRLSFRDEELPCAADAAMAASFSADDVVPHARVAEDLSGLETLDGIIRASGAAEVVVALDPDEHAELPKVARILNLAHIPFKVVPALFEASYRTTELLGYSEIPVIDVDVDPLDRVARMFKRALDLCVATAMAIVLLPLELAIMAAIAIESGLPVFYKHQRVGRNGRLFVLCKFRTTVKDADRRFAEVQAQNEVGFSEGRIFKMRKDPRVTRVGAVLRKLSADELPQLINVFKGEMSMVGPRPPLPREVEKYEKEHLSRLRAIPGITGLWQVSGRSDLDFDDMIRLDRHYLDNWSLRLDIVILLRTFLVVLGRKGAY